MIDGHAPTPLPQAWPATHGRPVPLLASLLLQVVSLLQQRGPRPVSLVLLDGAFLLGAPGGFLPALKQLAPHCGRDTRFVFLHPNEAALSAFKHELQVGRAGLASPPPYCRLPVDTPTAAAAARPGCRRCSRRWAWRCSTCTGCDGPPPLTSPRPPPPRPRRAGRPPRAVAAAARRSRRWPTR